MKSKIYRLAMCVGILFVLTSFSNSHPIKITSSLILLNPKTANLEMECRVFIDDFTNSINSTFTKNINLANLSDADKKGIENYFKEYYVITVNGKRYPLQYAESKVLEEHNVCILRFSQNVSSLSTGDQLCVENKLFFREFDFLQTNMVTVRIPPLVEEVYFEATSNNYSLPIDL